MSVWQRNDRAMLRQVLKNQVTIMDSLKDIDRAPGVTDVFMSPHIANRKAETLLLLGEDPVDAGRME